MSYAGVILVLAAGIMLIIMIASREVDRLRGRIVSELQDGVERDITLMSFVRDGCVLIDQKQKELLTLLRDRQGIVRQVVPFNRLLYSALICRGEVVARYQHDDPLMAGYIAQVLEQQDESAGCAQLQHGHGVKIISGAKGQGVICLSLASEQDARNWHARTGVIIRKNSEAAARIRTEQEQSQSRAVEPVRVADKPVAADEGQASGPLDDQVLLQVLEACLPDWLNDKAFIIVPERKLRDMSGVDISLLRFHDIMNRFRREKALPDYALSFTKNPDKWRISRRR